MTQPIQFGASAGAGVRRVVSPAPRDAWHAALAADPTALPSQGPAWLDATCSLAGWADASRLYEFDDGRQAVLPLVRRRLAGLPLPMAASFPPGWGIGGLVAPNGARASEIASVLADLAAQPYVRTFVRPNPETGVAWANPAGDIPGIISVPRTAHVLDLEGGFERVWAERFSTTTRRNVRKAEREGVSIERDTTGDLVPIYYQLYLRSLERWADKQHEPHLLARWRGQRRDSETKLRGLIGALGSTARLWIAWHNDRPAAGILVLQDGNNAHYTRGAMDRDIAAPVRANDLLHRTAIEDACNAGCRAYHMGETGNSESLARFKEGFGARAVPYADYTLERLPLTALDRRLRGLIKAAIRFRDA